jgi:hypothetical protein
MEEGPCTFTPLADGLLSRWEADTLDTSESLCRAMAQKGQRQDVLTRYQVGWRRWS